MNIRSYEGHTPQIDAAAWVAPEAVVIGRVRLAEQVSVWPGAVMRGDVCDIEVGARSNIQDGVVVHGTNAGPMLEDGSNTIVGEDVTVGHNAVLHGCQIGDRCLIGMGAIVLDCAVIEDDTIVGAGSLVPPGKRLEGGYLWMGSPVKKIRPISESDRENLLWGVRHYVDSIAAHRAACDEDQISS